MDPMQLIAAGLCFAVGMSLGLLGGGGSVLMVPIFVYVAGLSAAESIGLSLLVVGCSSIIGAVKYFRTGCVNQRLLLLFIIPGIAASIFGARVAARVDAQLLLFMFGALMAVIAVILFVKSSEKNQPQGPVVCRPSTYLSAGVGAVIGFLTGLLGVGGGFLIVPAIALLMRCSMCTAVGTSLAIIAINSLSGFIGHLPGMTTPLPLILLFLASAMSGALVGTRVAGRIGTAILQKGFAVLVLALGALLIFKNFPF